jgi:hypothetical protein
MELDTCLWAALLAGAIVGGYDNNGIGECAGLLEEVDEAGQVPIGMI